MLYIIYYPYTLYCVYGGGLHFDFFVSAAPGAHLFHSHTTKKNQAYFDGEFDRIQ